MLVLLSALVLAAGAAGCGGKSSSTSSTSTTHKPASHAPGY
ncbi:MAG TPA: hypothetical protein VMS02_00140 [Solirubrobacteraceae bacterium]|nr:hypothetical protein [Solirubrobacteraceae bacterium]